MNDAIKKIISPHRMRNMSGYQKMYIPADRIEWIVNDIVNAIAEAVEKERIKVNMHNSDYEAISNKAIGKAVEIINSFKEIK